MDLRVGTGELAERFSNLLGARVSIARSVLDQHGRSEQDQRLDAGIMGSVSE